jgi:hypothetical protein
MNVKFVDGAYINEDGIRPIMHYRDEIKAELVMDE